MDTLYTTFEAEFEINSEPALILIELLLDTPSSKVYKPWCFSDSSRKKTHHFFPREGGAMASKIVFNKIVILGMGRMSIGLAIDLALKGLKIDMIDLKARPADLRRQYEIGLRQDWEKVIKLLNREIESFQFPP